MRHLPFFVLNRRGDLLLLVLDCKSWDGASTFKFYTTAHKVLLVKDEKVISSGLILN